ncbi:AMP-binding protein [Pueribacillus sp. YX66]|uniref:AMP-binding protein n=1 Tax=Pueribacillus sp. YX66 TaxID=3229242 RepID=UPI00358D28B5
MTEAVQKQWLDLYPDEIPHHIDYDERPLYAYLQEAAKEQPDKIALHFMGKELSYREVYESALKLANELRNLGLQKGDRVAIMLPNTPQSVISYYGVLLAGGTVVQTNPLYTERELEHQLKDAGVKILICVNLVHPRVMKVKANTSLEHIIVTSIKDYLPFPKNLLYPLVQKRDYPDLKLDIQYNETMHRFTDLIKRGATNEISLDIEPKKDVALLQYTGGTTGLAKGVVLTHFNLTANTQQCRAWVYKMEDGKERVLAILPFFHVYGMTVAMNLSIMSRSKMIIMPKFDPLDTLKTIQKQRPTLFPGAPTMYIGLVNHPEINNYDLSSIDACISGSAALPVEVQQKFEEITKGKLVEGYGLTEASPVTHANFIWGNRVSGSIGVPWPDTDAKVMKEDGKEAEVGEIGELVIKGPQVMQGYWNRPEETAETLKDGWLYTGDMAYMDEKGYFYIVDRKKDMIIAGGFNIYPREIEEVLYEHEAIQEAVAVGVPDEYRGETVKAFIVLKEGKQVTEKELDEYCRKHLAAYKVPRLYEFRDELPKTMVGKVLRRALLEEEKQKANK